MRLHCCLVGLCLAAGAGAQGIKPPKQVANLDFLLGSWVGTAKITGTGPTRTKSTVTAARSIGARFVESEHEYVFGPGNTMHGKQLLTYDAAAKQYRGYWFDESEAEPMIMTGTLVANVLTLTTKPMKLSGSPAPVVFQIVWHHKGSKDLSCLVRSKVGSAWKPLVEAKYTKR